MKNLFPYKNTKFYLIFKKTQLKPNLDELSDSSTFSSKLRVNLGTVVGTLFLGVFSFTSISSQYLGDNSLAKKTQGLIKRRLLNSFFKENIPFEIHFFINKNTSFIETSFQFQKVLEISYFSNF